MLTNQSIAEEDDGGGGGESRGRAGLVRRTRSECVHLRDHRDLAQLAHEKGASALQSCYESSFSAARSIDTAGAVRGAEGGEPKRKMIAAPNPPSPLVLLLLHTPQHSELSQTILTNHINCRL